MYEWGLIDLKRLHDDVEYWEQHDDPKQSDYDTRDIEGVINSQPIVEAIPVQWIKNYLKTSPKMWQGYHDEDLVQEMIEDWDKENEI